ncbi:MAG TPA: two-component regulator propeller domain-containing protein, partial [bacterium]|nr:two-component regulator propeller domain-containing protein [bacterium]
MQGWLMGGIATDRVSDRLILSALLMIWAILVLAAGTAQGNTRNRPAPSIRFNRITTADGLTSNNINDLLQDRMGLLWFATDDGLNRFDGYDMRIFRT